MKRRNIRLLVMGDEQVGKSSFINSIISQVPNSIQKTMKKVILPPEMCIYSKEVFTELVDTSTNTHFQAQINQSDLILLLYDVSEPFTIDKIQNETMKLINHINPAIPVILVGNKVDKKELQFEQVEHSYMKVKDVLKKITRKYKQVQMGIECSAFYERNVQSVLNCAQRAVLYPLHPLYNLQTRQLTIQFKKALIRIFRILDSDLDGRIYDPELNSLQERVFQSELNVEDIKAIKEIILKDLDQYHQDFIDINGFLSFQKKCIEMLKIQICWSILRYFNYDDNLKIIVNADSQHQEQSFYLSNTAVEFLISLHGFAQKHLELENRQKWQKLVAQEGEKEGRNSQIEQMTIVHKIFQSSPRISLTEFQQNLSIDCEEFLNAWNMYAFTDSAKCYHDLLYLGYQLSFEETFNRKKVKKSLKQFQKLKDDPIFSILIIDNSESQFLNGLMSQGVRAKEQDVVYDRKVRVFGGQHKSKTFMLFRIHKKQLKDCFKLPFMNKIDLMIDMTPEGDDEFINDMIPQGTLYKKMNKKLLQEFQVLDNISIDLEAIPVHYKPQSFKGFFKLILHIIENIQLGLQKDRYQKLKLIHQRNNEILLTSVGISGVVLIAGAFLAKRFWN